MSDRLSGSRRIARVCLLLVAAIAVSGGALQMIQGQPETTPRLDNVHRFMAGVYLSTGLISLWAALTIRRQEMLVLLIALGILLSAAGRMLSIATMGLPEPSALWLGYLGIELVLGSAMAAAWVATRGS
ncbi:MAG TPA: DUF4345 family protein [Allosphingosinicella sp.]|jgi:hypothetical protein